MNKKAQIQIGETIAVLFVFFILIIVGFIFYVKVIKGNIALAKEESSQLRSVGIAQRVMFLPEIQCSEDNIIIDNCVDILKLEAAKDIISKNQIYYYDLLEFGEMNVTQIYPTPSSADEGKWNIYSRKIGNFTNKFVTNVPISLYDANSRKHKFGILTIETILR